MPFNAVIVILWICAVIWLTAEGYARIKSMEKSKNKPPNDVSLEDFEK